MKRITSGRVQTASLKMILKLEGGGAGHRNCSGKGILGLGSSKFKELSQKELGES